MSEQNKLNILVVDTQPESAKAIAGLINASGYSVKGKIIETQEKLVQALASQKWDIIFIDDAEQPEITIQTLKASLTEQQLTTPLFVIADSVNEKSRCEAIQAGATEVISLDNPELFKFIIESTLNLAVATDPAPVVAPIVSVPDNQATLTAEETLWYDRIKVALQNDRFITVYQPIVHLDAEPSENYEVLLRMQDDYEQEIAASEFIGSAIKSGLMGEIDRWVIGRVIQLSSQRRSEGKKTRLFIKLSNDSLCDPNFWLWLSEQLINAKLPKSSLVFEITEEDALKNQASTQKLITTLKRLNCEVALDHAGLNEMSQEFWASLDLDYIKISGHLTLNLNENDKHKMTIRDIAIFAKENNILTIAQYIQEPKVLSYLWRNSINYIQGHFLQRPTAELNYDFTK